MVHIVLATSFFIGFLILCDHFKGKAHEKGFLLIFGLGAFIAGCVSLYFVPEGYVKWLRAVYWVIPMGCFFRWDKIRKKK